MRLESGTRLGPYEIQSLLGSGGMGEVYRARDTRLNRSVAIKILPEEACSDLQRLSRFEQEARSASALNHQNIITIYDIGKYNSSPFIAMELVEGKTLRQILSSGPVPVKDMLNVATQLSEGLACAHEAGIVHRDLKPENVIVNKDAVAKILDFGLAKLCKVGIPGENASQIPTAAHETESGILLGTIGYMSPEQASGQPADFRSDQFSLGTILYEMAAGRSPFRRNTAAETLTAIIREEPEPIESLNAKVPAPLERLLRRCLSKSPAERYASTRDLARDLRDLKEHWSASTTRVSQTVQASPVPKRTRIQLYLLAITSFLLLSLLIGLWMLRPEPTPPADSSSIRSIAVLPFTEFGNQKQEEYFSDGMTEALITELAKVPGMKVTARNSVFQYKGRNVNVGQVGKELGVNYVLEGSLQRSGDRLRVHAQLIHTRTGYHLWAERYDRSAADLFGVQDDISKQIGSALKLTLSETPAAEKIRPTENLEAYDLYLRGKYLLNNISEEDLNQAIPHLEKAIALDSQFALAHAALGNVYRQKFFFVEPKKEWEERAFVEIEKAIVLDPNLAEAYAARGRLIWTRKNNYPHEKSADDYKKAIKLDPNLAEVHVYLGGIYHHVGLVEEALQEVTTALKLDPTNSLGRSNRVMALFFHHEYQQALSASEQSPGDEIWRALSLLYLGDIQKSATVMKELLQTEPQRRSLVRVWDASFLHSCYAALLAKTGDKAEAEKHIRMAIEKDRGLGHFHHSEYNIALAYALMGKTAPAIEWLQKTGDHGFSCYPFFEKDPHLKNLHGQHEFETFLEKMKQQRNYYRAKLLVK
ncbi:protein kinase [bacterium]|nr:protein kinase [bacterium]